MTFTFASWILTLPDEYPNHALQSNQPLHPTTSGGLTAAVVADERRR
jgi:hypothetical protein